MSVMMFYERPVPLSRQRHVATRLSLQTDHYRFASTTNAIPVTGAEFSDVARDYPIFFVGDAQGAVSVVALVGLSPERNLMVDAQGRWAHNTYVPAFARRYPFVLAADDGQQGMAVCLDEAYRGLGPDEGQALFDEHAQETDYLKRVLAFLYQYHQQAMVTAQFIEQLRVLDLLVPKTMDIDIHGQAHHLTGLWAVDAERYRRLTAEQLMPLFRSGQQAWIDAHLQSLDKTGQLIDRLAAAAQATC